MIFTYRYCRMLEEGSFRGKSADFAMMFIFGAVAMITFAFFVNLLFLGQVKTNLLITEQSKTKSTGLHNNAGVCVGEEKPLYQDELFWSSHLQRALPALGPPGLLSPSWQLGLRRFIR